MAAGNGNGSGSQVDLLLQVVNKVDRLEKRFDLFAEETRGQLGDIKETLGVIATTLAKSVQVTSVRLDEHERRILKLEKSS